MARFSSLSSLVTWTYSFSNSNILGKDTANGSTLDESSTSAKISGLVCPVFTLMGPAGGASPACGVISLSGLGASGGDLSIWYRTACDLPCLNCSYWMIIPSFSETILPWFHPAPFGRRVLMKSE